MAPLGEQRPIRRSTSDIAADGHRAKCASVIALAARKNEVTSGLPFFNMKLTRELDSCFCRFGASRREVNAAAFSKIGRSHREQPSRKFFRWRRMKLRSVCERNFRGLFSHRTSNFGNSMADIDHCGLACRIEKFSSIR